jgi:thiamine kinase-like enzyme
VSPSIEELRTALCKCLSSRQTTPGAIVALDRSSSQYASTAPLEDLRVVMADGTRLDVVFKNLSPSAIPESRRQAKPTFLRDPLREITAYRVWSKVPRFAMAECYGAIVDVERERYWLFLEKLRAHELYTVGDFEAWKEVARWLARMHADGEPRRQMSPSNRWIKYDARYFRSWAPRAKRYCCTSASPPSSTQISSLSDLIANYEPVVSRLAALPVTFIHGEFYASNILISGDGLSRRIRPIDWEMAGIGTGLIDLAALTSGRWTTGQREEMAAAYFEALDEHGKSAFASWEAFLLSVDDCRLHLALQWLGWSRNWIAPPEHAYNWLNEALLLGMKVGCL